MGFDLTIAVAPNSTLSPGSKAGSPPVPIVSIDVSGTFTNDGRIELSGVVERAFSEGADTIYVEMQDVAVREPAALAGFADDMMGQRSAGRQVQVVVRSAELHARCAALPHSEDWLLASTTEQYDVGRRSVHVEGTD